MCRILAGWVPGKERANIALLEATSAATTTRRYLLWPFDRPESRGKLKGITIRIAGDKLLILGFRSLPGWGDVRVSRFPDDSSDGPLIPDEMRYSTRGLSVEYIRKYKDGGMSPLQEYCSCHLELSNVYI
jgi:hypothetical protein